MNNSYARGRSAFIEHNPTYCQRLAKLQMNLCATCLTLEIDGTQRIQVRMPEGRAVPVRAPNERRIIERIDDNRNSKLA
jgi:hypothetical protein